ncbi:hypothetical protein FJ959_22325 [Mesorhizobium sp. B2-2-4]|uniref:hypothetical protein n=1 Tax=unclassified Mesorhizobium TaxID=325217 RepID=UPI0011290410|nr:MULTISPECIES: hypothetical protein [unclassified Mesorhizobium]TPM53268.1 hypothetical protein FJ959_22325 [Mesorhizobium sp. B2-2-4]TPM62089.1 hypothetical protein FJ965_21045 [Mesorhizobium sp. B2-2-1]TPN68460.1 hypothetical protein FJ984_11525 [Mesorhizobium sp. B1-1-3]
MTDQADAGSVVVDPPAGNLAAPADGADNGSAAPEAKSWFDGLSEGNRKLADTKGWTKPEGGIEKVLSSYAELERLQGETLRVPAADASPEEWKKFHDKLPEAMRPVASADKIEFKRPEGLPADLPYDDGLANTSKSWMVDAGLNSKQSQVLHDKFAGHMAEMAKAQQIAIAESVTKTHDDLVKDWGPVTSEGFKEKLEVANRAMKGLGLVDAYKAKGILLADGSLTDPQIAKAFQAIGEAMFKEDKIGADGVPGGVNPFKRGPDGKIVSPAAISALVQSDPAKAKRLAIEAGENPDLWMPNNPL